jgi:hypothetical protein
MRSINLLEEYIDELNEIEFEKYSKSGYVKYIYKYSNNLFSFVIKMFILYTFYISIKYIYYHIINII